MTPNLESGLPRAVYHWLRFQLLCKRSNIFSESYLTQPVSEFLMSQHAGLLVPEYSHPVFQSLRGPGRPKQLDFALLNKNNKVQTVVEVKWVRDRAYDKQAIVDDLLRLECFRSAGPTKRYFLIAGRGRHVEENFEILQSNYNGKRVAFTSRLLSFDDDGPEHHVRILDGRKHLRPYFKDFSARYRCRLPYGFHTTLVGGVASSAAGISTYLWRVSSNRNRSTFDPKEEWAG